MYWLSGHKLFVPLNAKPDSYWSLSKQVSIFAEFIWIILSFASQIGLHRFSRSCTGTDILATIHQIKNIEILQTGHVTDAWCNGNKTVYIQS